MKLKFSRLNVDIVMGLAQVVFKPIKYGYIITTLTLNYRWQGLHNDAVGMEIYSHTAPIALYGHMHMNSRR